MTRATFEAENFTFVSKKDDRTNRSVFKCNHCQREVERRELRLLCHLSDQKTCWKASTGIRTSALAHLGEARGATAATAPAHMENVLTTTQTEGNGPDAILEPVPKKARLSQQSSINAFVDRAMSAEEKQGVDLAFLRYENLTQGWQSLKAD
jgi:superfamily II DNA helicase RecQ